MGDDFGHETRPAEGRGATILTLGILSIVLAGCSPAGLILGYLAVSKARADLPRFESGLLREEDRGLTKAGKTCGIVGLCLSGLAFLMQMLQLVIFLFAIVFMGTGMP